MTSLRSALDRYLSMHKGLGYKYEHQTRRLADFVAFMEKRKTRLITTKLAMEWATLPVPGHSCETVHCAGYAANLNSVAASDASAFCSALI